MVLNSMDQDTNAFELEELLARCMGKLDFAQRLLLRFEGRLEDDLDELEQHISAGDSSGIAQVAHRIKGASANISAPRLHEQATNIEQLARADQLEEIAACLEQLRAEQAQFLKSVAATLPSEETALDAAK